MDDIKLFTKNEKRIGDPNTGDENIRRSLNKFPNFFRMGTFIDRTHMKL